jgi:hypothetical protein
MLTTAPLIIERPISIAKAVGVYHHRVLDQTSIEYKRIVHDFHETTVRHRRYQTVDHSSAPVFEVDRIEYIYNPQLHAQYKSRAQLIAQSNQFNIASHTLAFRPMEVFTFDDVNMNEFMLYHGTPFENVTKICESGTDVSYAGENAGKLFGCGTYLAVNSSKADIYTTPGPNDLRCVFLMRTLLGKPCYASEPMKKIKRAPDSPFGPCDSVIASVKPAGCVEYPECIVYKDSQVLPEFAIYYRHASGCACTHCA